jgi:hypothetical protein
MLKCDFMEAFFPEATVAKRTGEGDAITVTWFNDLAKTYDTLIEEEKLYYISKGNIKPTKFKSQTVRHPCEITIDLEGKVLND